MKLAIGCDHGGFASKELLVKHLKELGHEVIDVGCFSTDSVNYAEFGIKCAELVSSKTCEYGIVICTSGEGISMAANKVCGVRCGIAYNDEVAKLMRLHNDANVISFGAKFMPIEDIIRRTDIFLSTKFEGGRHVARVETINNYKK